MLCAPTCQSKQPQYKLYITFSFLLNEGKCSFYKRLILKDILVFWGVNGAWKIFRYEKNPIILFYLYIFLLHFAHEVATCGFKYVFGTVCLTSFVFHVLDSFLFLIFIINICLFKG